MSSQKTTNPAEPKVWVAGEELQTWVRRDLTAHVGNLEGQWLTIVDATFSDPQQRKAMKDIVRKMIWDWDIQILDGVCPQRQITSVYPDGRPNVDR